MNVDNPTWGRLALDACLHELTTSHAICVDEVQVVDAWADTDDSFCVVYRPPFAPAWIVGLRREGYAAQRGEDGRWTIPDGSAEPDPIHPADPLIFGQSTALYDIGEPLGTVAMKLRHDAGDVGWWGDLGSSLPMRPRHAGERVRDASLR